MENIVITGIGAYTPYGKNKDDLISLATKKEVLDNHLRIEQLDFSAFSDENSFRRMDRLTHIALIAFDEAIRDSKIALESQDPERIGAIINTNYGPVSTVSDYLNKIIKGGMRASNPSLFPNTVLNASLGQLSIRYKLKGFSSMVVGSSPLVYACDALKDDKADIICVGGIDEYNPIIEEYYRRKGLFDKKFVYSEGAGFVMLEKESHAVKRGAPIYCRVTNYAQYTDCNYANQFVTLDKEVIQRAMQEALKGNEESVSDLVSLNNPVMDNEELEMQLLKTIAPGPAAKVQQHKIKRVIGESFSGSEVIALAYGAALCSNKQKKAVLVNAININGNLSSVLLGSNPS